MTPSPEGWPTKAKEAPSPHEVRLAPLDTNPVFQSLGGKAFKKYSPKNLVKRFSAKKCTPISLIPNFRHACRKENWSVSSFLIYW